MYVIILKRQPLPPLGTVPARVPSAAFAPDDLEVAVERLRAHHVELSWDIGESTDSRRVRFHVPAGNLIELAHFKAFSCPTCPVPAICPQVGVEAQRFG